MMHQNENTYLRVPKECKVETLRTCFFSLDHYYSFRVCGLMMKTCTDFFLQIEDFCRNCLRRSWLVYHYCICWCCCVFFSRCSSFYTFLNSMFFLSPVILKCELRMMAKTCENWMAFWTNLVCSRTQTLFFFQHLFLFYLWREKIAHKNLFFHSKRLLLRWIHRVNLVSTLGSNVAVVYMDLLLRICDSISGADKIFDICMSIYLFYTSWILHTSANTPEMGERVERKKSNVNLKWYSFQMEGFPCTQKWKRKDEMLPDAFLNWQK